MKRKLMVSFMAFALMLQMFLSTTYLQYTAFAAAGEVDTANWMNKIDGNKMLSQFSIPGTHETCALYGPPIVPQTAICQTMSLADQLNAGIRYLDIRCRDFNNTFTIHHGPIYQHTDFGSVRDICLQFLRNHPSECIIMSIKQEYSTSGCSRSFEDTYNWYLQGNIDKWYLNDTIPKLNDVRGKIVLLRRFAANSTPKGIDASNWGDNQTFTRNIAGNGILRVQDQYKYNDTQKSDKWNAVKNLLDEASSSNSTNTLYINYTSAVGGYLGVPAPNHMADYINDQIEDYFASHSSGRFGIVPMDFVTANLSKLVINSNPLF